MISLIVMLFVVLLAGMVVHEVGHYVPLRNLRAAAQLKFRPFRLCQRGVTHTNHFQELWKYEKVVSLASGLYAEFGFGLTLCTVSLWFSPSGSLVWAIVLLGITVIWWARGHDMRWLLITTAPWLLVLLTVVGFLGLAWGTRGSFFENLLCVSFAPMISASVNSLPFEWSSHSDGTRLAKIIQRPDEPPK